MDKPTVYKTDPVKAAKAFEADGAEWLHIIDLDAVDGRERDNTDLITRIIKAVNVPVQDPAFVAEAATRHPGKIVVSVDARGGKVVSEGWKSITAFSPLEFARQFEAMDLGAIIFTDIDRDDELPESSLAQTTEMATSLILPVIASGPVKTLDDLSTLRYLPNIAGAITGRALFNGTFTLPEAIEVARTN